MKHFPSAVFVMNALFLSPTPQRARIQRALGEVQVLPSHLSGALHDPKTIDARTMISANELDPQTTPLRG